MTDDLAGDAIDARRLIIPGLAGLYRSFAPVSYAFMRFSTGAVLFPHGVQMLGRPIAHTAETIGAHGLLAPLFLAYCTFFAEFVASVLLALGLLTRIAAATIFIQMVVIVTVFQWHYGYFWTSHGYEFPLLWALLCFAIFFRGGGRYSLDRLIGREF